VEGPLGPVNATTRGTLRRPELEAR
jgi:hypothetical protein